MGQQKVMPARVIKTLTYLIVASLAWVGLPVQAEPGEYQIELIIFSQEQPNTEVFDQMSSEIVWPANIYEAYDYKKADTLTLTDTYAAIARNSVYQPLLHMGWIQKVNADVLSAPVHVHSADGRINGFVLMQHSQVFQLTADLEYIPGAGSSDSSLIYRLNQSRQVKLDELNYLDHPKLGVIAKVTAK